MSSHISFIDRNLPRVKAILLLCLIVGLYLATYGSPPDYQHGNMVRLMYIHVPAAWMSTLIYMLMSVSGVLFLLKRNIYADHVNVVLAPIGMSFTFITIVTGMIWAKPMWGKWWVWDVRLTSVLVLFFFYLVYWILRKVLDETERTMVATSSLLLVGCINIPIVKFSVNFWNSIHQPTSVSLIKGSTIDKNILIPLLSMFVCAVIYSTVVFMTRLRCRLLDVGEVDG